MDQILIFIPISFDVVSSRGAYVKMDWMASWSSIFGCTWQGVYYLLPSLVKAHASVKEGRDFYASDCLRRLL